MNLPADANSETFKVQDMSLRDYMAIHAGNEDISYQIKILREKRMQLLGIGVLPDNYLSIVRYMVADEMLAASGRNIPYTQAQLDSQLNAVLEQLAQKVERISKLEAYSSNQSLQDYIAAEARSMKR